MDIVIIANFTGDFSETDNHRFLYLAKMLSKDNDVEIVTSRFFHITKKKRDNLAIGDIKVTLLDEPGYKKNISLKRFYSHYIWGKNVKKYLNSRKKPNIVYAAVPSLTASLCAAKYCQQNSIKFVIDINDLWPEAFRMLIDIPVISDIAFIPFNAIANGIYRRADYIFGVSQTYVDRALKVNHRCLGSQAVYIGTDLDTFDDNVMNNTVVKPTNELWLGYCGSLSASYDLIMVMDALVLVRDKGMCPPKFVVMGDGSRMEEFKSYAYKKQLNVLFMGRLSYDKMCGMLNACDIVINPIKSKSAASIINKHADYAACGCPVVNTQTSEEYRKLVKEYKMGINCRNGSSVEVAEAIIRLMTDESLRCHMGQGARKSAREVFDRKYTYNCILTSLL